MRLVSLYVRTGILVSLMGAVCGCNSAQKHATAAPPAPPAIKQAPQSAASAQEQKAAPEQKPQTNTNAEASAPKQPASEPTPASTQTDEIGDLIARAEKQYQAGLTDYHAGKQDEARQEFDNALNELLGSKFDVRSDDRLGK